MTVGGPSVRILRSRCNQAGVTAADTDCTVAVIVDDGTVEGSKVEVSEVPWTGNCGSSKVESRGSVDSADHRLDVAYRIRPKGM
jgi:hypothetical protein